MGIGQSIWVKGAVCVVLAAALGACRTTGTQSSYTPATAGQYANQGASGIEVEPLAFDPNEAPKACINDLRVYRAHLQMPASSRIDLNKPVNNYIQEAGSREAALSAINTEINRLNQQLELELARRNPFNEGARDRADDTIAAIEDGILLNEALAEALSCAG